MRRMVSTASLLLLLAGSVRSVRADVPAGDVALAETLFQEAQKLMHEKRFAEACPKFQESQRLDPGGGTLFQLATCHSLTGKIASAWAEFGEVALLAQQRNRPDIERAAKEQVHALEPRLSRLVIAVPDESRLPALSVKRDGSALGEGAYGTAMPADPGEHTIRVEAPGHESWTITVQLGENADKKTVNVPLLKKTPERPAEPARIASREPPQPKRSPALFYGSLVVGVAGVGVATYFGIRSYSKEQQANDRCPQPTCSDQVGVDASKSAVSAANVANVAGAAGLVGLGVATYLLITGAGPGGPAEPPVRVSTQMGSGNLTMSVVGRF